MTSLPWWGPWRTSLELSEAILTLYAVGVSTWKISAFLEGIYGAFYSPQSISWLSEVTQEQVKAWRERPLSAEYYAVFFGWDLRKNGQGTGVHCSWNQARWTKGDPRVLALGRGRGKCPELGGGSQGSQAPRGKGCAQ